MDTNDLETIWEAHARYDPLWAILSDPTKKNRGWDIDRFFESGEREVRFLLRDLEASGIELRRRAALDFGCGIGRLTQALAHYFESVVGVDISSTMIALARELNPDPEGIRFVRNRGDDLADISSRSFDFVYTNIVLQHIPPELTTKYLEGFLRVLRPRGVLVFQLPSHPRVSEGEVRAMPDGAYRAEIDVAEWPRTVTPASRIGLAVRVVNASSHPWHPSALGQINLANHWLASDGTMVVQDDARAGLPRTLRPGEQAEIHIAVTAPENEGAFHCELDLVHETITWFHDRGSESCRLPIEVSTGARPSENVARATSAARSRWSEAWKRALERLPDPDREPKPFPMFSIPRDDVLEFLERQGAEILAVDEDGHAGWDWVGYRYTVRTTAPSRQ